MPEHYVTRPSHETPEGETRYEDISVSGTNSSERMKELFAFDRQFLSEDPRLQFAWPEDVWDSIENQRLRVGMTEQQVRMSWEEPEHINRTITASGVVSEQWVYGSQYVYFEDGKVTAIQD